MITKKKNKSFVSLSLLILIMLTFALLTPQTVSAFTYTTYSKPFFGTDGSWWRYATTTETKWTSAKYVAGQPTKGTYLKKGNFLYYSSSGGNSVTVSMSVGYGVGSIGVSVPLGKKASSGVGTGLIAGSNGYYKIKAKKQVTVKAKTSQKCASKAGTHKPNGKWKNAFTKKSYTTVRVHPYLVKQK